MNVNFVYGAQLGGSKYLRSTVSSLRGNGPVYISDASGECKLDEHGPTRRNYRGRIFVSMARVRFDVFMLARATGAAPCAKRTTALFFPHTIPATRLCTLSRRAHSSSADMKIASVRHACKSQQILSLSLFPAHTDLAYLLENCRVHSIVIPRSRDTAPFPLRTSLRRYVKMIGSTELPRNADMYINP